MISNVFTDHEPTQTNSFLISKYACNLKLFIPFFQKVKVSFRIKALKLKYHFESISI